MTKSSFALTNMKDAAVALARKGFAVFPCVAGAKKPLLMGGYKLATLDEFQIVAWWDEHPDANIGCHPDACEPRYLVVDVDLREAEDGFETIGADTAGLYPETVTTLTPSGGDHLWYVLPEDCPKVQSSTRKLGAGLDVRSYGGYVIMPPSKVGSKLYLWGDTVKDFAVAPIELIAAAGHAQDRHPDADVWQCEPDLPENIERAALWLLEEAIKGRVAIAGQGGNNFTYATAAILRDMGISEEKAINLMCEQWNRACKPPWEGGELGQIVSNSYEYATRPAGNRTAKPESVERMQAMQVVQGQSAQPTDAPSDAGIPALADAVMPALADAVMPADAVSKPRFPVIWGEDINKVKEPKWLVEQAIQITSVVEFYGSWSSGKTLVALDLALSVSLGLEWAGHLCQRVPTVLVTNEGVYSISKRRRAWMELHEVYEAPDFGLVADMPLFSDQDQVRALGASLTQAPCGMLIIDTMAQAMAGMDENSQKDASLFLRYCYELRDLLQCSVIILHHTGKDQARGSRGSTAIPGGMDTVFEVTQPERGAVLVTMKKQKDGAPWILPARFIIHQAADSVSLKSTTGKEAAALDEHETQHIAWEIATRELLIAGKKQGAAMPVGNKVLAAQLADHVTGGDSVVSDALLKQLYQWLRRPATANRPGLKPFVCTWTDKGVAATWQPPAD